MKTINEKEKLQALLKCVEIIFNMDCKYLDNFRDFNVDKDGEQFTVTNKKYKEILIVGNTVVNVNHVAVEMIAKIACIECLYQDQFIDRMGYFGVIGKIIKIDNLGIINTDNLTTNTDTQVNES